MNREIKFRAFIAGLGMVEEIIIMHPISEGSAYSWYIHYEGFQDQYPDIDLGDEDSLDEKFKLTSGDDFIYGETRVMQFTGKNCYFNDSESKPLYEGDIVETVYGNMECVWNDDKCCWQVENEKHWFDFHEIDISIQPIIGNIFENPELLNTINK